MMSHEAVGPKSGKTFLTSKLNFDTIAGSLLILFYMLMPLDRSFPGLPLGGKTVGPAFFSSAMVLGFLYITSKGKILSRFSRGFTIYHLLFTIVLIPSSMISKDPVQAFQTVLRYFATFVIDYVIIVFLIEKYGPRWLVRSVLSGGVLAALIAVADTVGGIRLPIYQRLSEINSEASGWGSTGGTLFDTFRGIGTMGNPLIMAVLMMVCVPYVFNIKSSTLRVIILGILFAGAAVTVSRTIAVGILVYFVGCAFIYKRKFFVVVGTTVGIMIVLGGTALGTFLSDDPRVLIWESRLGVPGVQGADTANDNLAIRQEVSQKAIREIGGFNPKELLLGKGVKSTATIGEDLYAGYTTIDNATVTLLYEEGVIGLFLFYGSFAYILWRTRKQARSSLHWYNTLALLACSISFDFEVYSTFNILVVGSIAIISAVPLVKPEYQDSVSSIPEAASA